MSRRTPDRPVTWAIATAFAIVAVATRVPRLAMPRVFVWDEIFYANDALDLVTRGVEQPVAVHPPLGKWLIAAGIRMFGFTPFGWRIAAVIAGVATVVIAVFVARRATGSAVATALVGLTVVTDGVMFVTGRLALLDGFVAFWCTALVLVLVTLVTVRHDGAQFVLLTVGAGVLVGAAIATKWFALPMLPVTVATVVWTVPAANPARKWRRVLAGAGVLVFAVSAYTATYGNLLVHGGASLRCGNRRCDATLVERVRGLLQLQVRNAEFHTDLRRTNPYLGDAWQWPVQEPGAVFFAERCTHALAQSSESDGVCSGTSGGSARIVARGNRLLWVVGSVSLFAAVVVLLRRRRRLDPRDRALAVVTASAIALILPWLFAGDRTYVYFTAPVVPLLAVVTAALLTRCRRGTGAMLLLGAGVTVVFVLQYPSLTALPG